VSARHARIARRHAGLALATVWLALLAGTALANTPADTADSPASKAQAAAEAAVRAHFAAPGSRVEAQAVPLNTRLILDDCALPLRATVPSSTHAAPRVLVQVQCPQADGWDTRVTVKLQLWRSVLVAVRPLQRGDGVRAGDVRSEERDITALGYGYLENLEQTQGRSLARALAAGSVLTPAALGGRRMVRAGDHVQMIARVQGIEVRADGVALGSGDSGARLRVRNGSSGRVIDAMVSAPGEVTALP
jgi:flagella basal body P-ring formation protein FlgA